MESSDLQKLLENVSISNLLEACNKKYHTEIQRLQNKCALLKAEKDAAVRSVETFIREEKKWLSNMESSSGAFQDLASKYASLQLDYIGEVDKKQKLKARLAALLAAESVDPNKRRLSSNSSSNLPANLTAKKQFSDTSDSKDSHPRTGVRSVLQPKDENSPAKHTPSPKSPKNKKITPNVPSDEENVPPSEQLFPEKQELINPISRVDNLFVKKDSAVDRLSTAKAGARNKMERKILHATDCPCCKDYFKLVGTLPAPEGSADAGKLISPQERLQQNGRHRYTYRPEGPLSPENFWQV